MGRPSTVSAVAVKRSHASPHRARLTNGCSLRPTASAPPSLHLADVDSVIGYYLRHAPEIDAYRQQRLEQREAIRQQHEARFDPHGVRDRLLARRTSPGQ